MTELFRKYPSLTNASQSKFINGVRLYLPNDTTWLVTEKIHGANFQMIFDSNGNLTFASRNQHLGEFGSFYDLPGLKQVERDGKTLIQRVTDLYNHLKSVYPDVTQVNIFGEYAGTLTQGNKVQKEVDYGSQEFYIFDIVLSLRGLPFYVHKLEVRKFVEQFGLAQPALLLVTNSIDEALSVPNDFDSVSGKYKYFGAAEVPVEEIQFNQKNIAEGVVIEPDIPNYYKQARIIIKNKNSKFSENHTVKVMKKEVILTDEENDFLQFIMGYVNTNRVSNVCSHYGIGTREQLAEKFGFILKETMQDAISDIKKDLDGDLTMLDRVIKSFNRHVANTVREHLQSL